MAKTWYPVIDYASCIECGTCVNFCPHHVYDKAKAPSPAVTDTMSCVDHCHGCGKKCPVGAITYVGEDTGWTPPNGKAQEAEAPCCCGSDAKEENLCSCGADSSGKKVSIEYLYLDLNTCDRCIGTDAVLEEVVVALTPALELAGYAVKYKKAEITSADVAAQYRFLSSPTIRVNGLDICESVVESNCGCCGEISGTDVDCRVFEYEGKSYEVPPKAMLAESILKAAFGENCGCSCGYYELPENLKRFFDGKAAKTPQCSCGGNCR
jgi:NAD-dependent dihydropyrimidine dehydrogenase PreA subunit